MMTAEQYRASLNDGRETYFGGEQVFDLPEASDPRHHRRLGRARLRPLLRSEARRGRRVHEGAVVRARTARAGRVARVGRSAHARDVRIDHDVADRRRSHRGNAARERRAYSCVRQGRAATRRAHHAVHHRRQRRSQPPAGIAGRPRRIRARRQTLARRHRHPRREAAHLGRVDGSRTDDDSDEVDEGRRRRTTPSRAWSRSIHPA